MQKQVTLVKLGGAVITNKEIPNQLRADALDRLVKELAQAKQEKKICVVLGNGSGSFAHVPAARYQTKAGFINEESAIGMAITQDSAAQINREVVKACLGNQLPAVTVAPSNSLVTENRQAKTFYTDVFEQYLRLELLPVTYGDVIADTKQGCTIWSTDQVFSFFARQFTKAGWTVDQIIHVTEAEGVWQRDNDDWKVTAGQKAIYKTITPSMKAEVKKSMTDVKGFDVTGGMWHKLEEALSLTDLGIQSRIISGLIPGALYETLLGKSTFGTTITSD